MGHKHLYDIMKEERRYLHEDFSDEDGIRAAELEGSLLELNGKGSRRVATITRSRNH